MTTDECEEYIQRETKIFKEIYNQASKLREKHVQNLDVLVME